MASATDIITYIGVPLAVLGVLPIMYNTFVTLVNASKIKRMLRHSRLTALTRSDVVNRIIEIELPRYAVTPWDRFLHQQEYWQLSRNPSSIPGGSWTTFNWKTNAIGFKTQRVEYADQLRQPQVDIAFDELVSYLLDLGAVPDAHGWRLLRSTGLWAPVGCALMKSPDGRDTALSIAPLDDSDGNLSLSVTWQPAWTSRTYSDLPPYWVSLPAPPPAYKERAEETASREASDDQDGRAAAAAADGRRQGEAATPITCQISTDGIITALTEETRRGGGVARNDTLGRGEMVTKRTDTTDTTDTAASKGTTGTTDTGTPSMRKPGRVPLTSTTHLDSLYIEHIRVRAGATAGVWFASAATAYGTTSQTILWNYRIPDEVLAFARRDTVPCGVLVLLGAADEDETPAWATAHANDAAQALQLHVQRHEAQRAAVQAEQRLPPAQREAAARERIMRENLQRGADMRQQMLRNQERRAQRELEALHSARWDARRVAVHALRWLRRNRPADGDVDVDVDVGTDADAAAVPPREIAGRVLHRMVRDPPFAGRLCRLLDAWKSWADLGGMKTADLQTLRDDMALFAYAALIVALIQDTATELDGTLSVDLQECLRMWRKVRLG